jgi:hypothetical protein
MNIPNTFEHIKVVKGSEINHPRHNISTSILQKEKKETSVTGNSLS